MNTIHFTHEIKRHYYIVYNKSLSSNEINASCFRRAIDICIKKYWKEICFTLVEWAFVDGIKVSNFYDFKMYDDGAELLRSYSI
jgi:hypothetical protein